MKEMYRTKNGSVHLSDGEVNLAILNATDPKEPGHQPGIYHFGFYVEDSKKLPSASRTFIPRARQRSVKQPTPRGSDPDGNLFDISTVGWGDKRRMDL